MSDDGRPQVANCSPSGGSAAADLSNEAAGVGAHMSAAGPPQGANSSPSGGQRSGRFVQ
jgi:hypothetical protein